MACLISSNAIFVCGVHSILAFFFNISFKGFTILAKPVINFLTKLIFPKKDLNSFWLVDKLILEMASMCLGSINIPFFVIKCPNNLPSVTQNMHFFGFKEIPYLLHL